MAREARESLETHVAWLFYNPAVLRALPCRLLVASAICLCARAQTVTTSRTPTIAPNAQDPTLVTCGPHPPLTSRTVRGDTLVSPDGKHRAYAEVEAVALNPQRPPGYSGPLCVNNSRLYLAPDNGEFRVRFLQEPADVENGNSLRLLDWSADSRRLLAELAEWQYEQPVVTRSALLYDTRYGTFQQPDLAQALAKAYGHECLFDVRVLGFDAQGGIALEAQPLSPEEEEILGLPSCSKKKAYYAMDRATEALVSVPELPKLQHNAKVEPAK